MYQTVLVVKFKKTFETKRLIAKKKQNNKSISKIKSGNLFCH